VTPGDFSEDALIEQPAIKLFRDLGWETINAFNETFVPGGGTLGREASAEVILAPRLRTVLERLNRDAPAQAISAAIEELGRDRSALSAAAANKQVYTLLKEGFVTKAPINGREEPVRMRFIDWDRPTNNDFLLASQFWVTGDVYTRRADLVGFVNGIPVLFMELKATHRRLEWAFHRSLRDYRNNIPNIFWYNGFIVVSNGSQTRLGTMTAGWEHFAEWKKINNEREEGVISLDTVIRATCEPARFLDIVENFVLFEEARGGLIKVLAKNHQYLGVNNAVRALQARSSPLPRTGDLSAVEEGPGVRADALGVFWHTQGAGKSYSMMFFAQKVLRKLPGNFTFVVLTDRRELDDQIYGTFKRSGVVGERHVQAESADHLRRLLTEDHRYIFTLIQKFRADNPRSPAHGRAAGGEGLPILSDRSDIIVMADEAHRSQYDSFAANMRAALPNAAFIAFTGTPLMAGEQKTREVFGDYVSVYDFKQSVEDKSTVPLYYENRIPQLQLANEDLNQDMERLLEEAELDPEQERKLEREFARQYILITANDRLETIAKDIVDHFFSRGFPGKAMVVCIDKATAVRMYGKVQKYWKEYAEAYKETAPTDAYPALTDMAVVVSQSQNEVEDLEKKGADIPPHRQRMMKEDLASKFKDPDDPLRIVFVCAMWMTGFDAPSCSTIYLDKPMRNHTLMQTIARANRVFPNKENGLIVDYVGVFRDLQKALALYAVGGRTTELPVRSKDSLVQQLRVAVDQARAFLTGAGVNIDAILAAGEFEKVRLLDDAVDAIVSGEESKSHFRSLANAVDRAYRAVMPVPATGEFRPLVMLLNVLSWKLHNLTPEVDLGGVLEEVEQLLNESLSAEGYAIAEGKTSKVVDLTRLNFDALRRRFERGRKNTEAAQLKGTLAVKLAQMVTTNKSRIDYLQKFQQMIEEYNAGSVNVQLFFDQLVEFAKELTKEDQRAIAEGLTEEELAIFDILTRPAPPIKPKEEKAIKNIAQDLLETLKREKIVLDWRKRQQTRQGVRAAIEDWLDTLPASFGVDLFKEKCNRVYNHIYDSYFGPNDDIYTRAA